MTPYNCIIITGTTASGKTKLATQLAHQLQSEIISLDSRQVYKGLNIGTGKDLHEYTIEGKQIPYHLIDVVDVAENFHLQKFITHFIDAFNSITARHKMPILCGGTGLYINTILKQHQFAAIPIDEGLRANLQHKSYIELLAVFNQSKTVFSDVADVSSHKRLIRAIEINCFLKNNTKPQTNFPTLKPLVFCIDIDLEIRRNNITQRLNHRLQNGMVEEVEQLIKFGISSNRLMQLGLEYNYITQYVLGNILYNDMQKKLETAIHQFAKRQATWFRKIEREGQKINWITPNYLPSKIIEALGIN